MFAAIWTFGGPLTSDESINYRVAFSDFWKKEFPTVKFADSSTVFDFFLSPECDFVPWASVVPPYQHDTVEVQQRGIGDVMVGTRDTVRTTYCLDLLFPRQRPVLLVGMAGTGKTTVVRHKLRSLDSTEAMHRSINLNACTGTRGRGRGMKHVSPNEG